MLLGCAATDKDAHAADDLQELCRLELRSAICAGPSAQWGEENWVREVEERQPFGEIVHELRLRHDPAEVPVLLGVARGFLYLRLGDEQGGVRGVDEVPRVLRPCRGN